MPHDHLLQDDFWSPAASLHPVHVINCAYDDTWVRDYGPLTLIDDDGPLWADFRFDGWGGRSRLPLSGALVGQLSQRAPFRHLRRFRHDQVLEGGAIDSDGRGTLLTTTRCLRRRCPDFRKSALERRLAAHLGAARVLWLDHGELLGDVSDSPVDMLARFASEDTIVYQGCSRVADPHYPFLSAMAAQLATYRTAAGRPYRLLELPLPHTMGRGEFRVPATYASFLILNRAVLMPSYRDPDNDARAAAVLGQAFPNREIVPIDSRILITQGRGLHAAVMQLPVAARAAAAGETQLAMPTPSQHSP